MTAIRHEDLLSDPNAATKLRLADAYMLHTERTGRNFVLPREHAYLGDLLTKYGKSLSKFVSYVKDVRDSQVPKSRSYNLLQDFYRTLEVRLVQQQRRERVRKAMSWLEEQHPKLQYEAKMRWCHKVEQQWGRRRMEVMEAARKRTPRHRLNAVEREQILSEFWQEIDTEIARGKLPPL